jgi:hypothetical protein
VIEIREATLRRLRVCSYVQLTGFRGSRCRAVRVFRPRGLTKTALARGAKQRSRVPCVEMWLSG